MSRYIVWRNGRPRFQPSAREQALGFRGKDLRHANGRWFTFEEARSFSAAKYQEIIAARAAALKRPRAGRPRGTPTWGYVYFLICGAEIKIGFSRKPFDRASDLRTGWARDPSTIIAVRGSRSHEHALHAKFSQYRLQGEWFEAAPALLATIAELLRSREKIGGVCPVLAAMRHDAPVNYLTEQQKPFLQS